MSNSGSTLIDAVNAAYPAMAQFYASDWYVAESANEGWYVAQGCAIVASATSGKVDMSAGTIIVKGYTEQTVAAVTAASTTITSLADATNPKWVALELDTSGTLNFNAGTAAANPEKPTVTTNRVVTAWLYVPANATTVDALTSTANGKAKIIDARMLTPGPALTGWMYDQNTWTYSSGTQFTVNGVDATSYLTPGTKISYNDGAVDYGVIASSSFSTNTTVSLITTSDYSIANATLIRPRYSYATNPQGFPTIFNWSPTLSGWSANPATTIAQWQTVGRNILLHFLQTPNGTSNSATHTATLPVTAATISNMIWIVAANGVDNGTVQNGCMLVASAGTTLQLFGIATQTNTASGGSRHFGQIWYEF